MIATPSHLFGLEAARGSASIALVVVDMQFFDAHRDWGEGLTARTLGVSHLFEEYFEQIDSITPAIARLLALFRQKSMEVIHLRVSELTQDSRDVGLKQLVRGLVVPVDSKEAEFLPHLEPEPNEIVINKSSSGVFASTNLDRILRNIGIDTLVFVGTATGGCIQSAVYDATDLGYNVVLVPDACADTTRQGNEASLAALDAQATAAMTAAEIEAALRHLPDVDPAARSGLERVRAYMLSDPYLPNLQSGETIGPYATIFGPAVPLTIRKETAALVLVDCQRLTCDPRHEPRGLTAGPVDYSGYFERVEKALPRLENLLAACRRNGYPVIHVRTAGYLADGRDLSRKRRQQGVRTTVDSVEAEFMPQVAPRPGEAVLNKPGSSIFNGTGLDAILANLGIENLILAGASLDGTIESSMRSAGDRGYGTWLVTDACVAAAAVETQFLDAERGIINARTLDETLAVLPEAQSAKPHPAES
ncbi:cysteine hydrolase family protein [Microvirga antarctica]|uniref:cysteine hydrolase family protein n=1 Tax=Microvirga antarctica TaxID=2819233 RepID=UPI001B30FCDE|nr:isochorismatase family cysteine hydrolase [Microvirga antarctica]